MYLHVTTSVGGFIQQLAVCYVGRGYWFYVPGKIPEGKDPEVVDQKLIEKYGINLSKYQRCRRKRAGFANLQYLRYGRTFLMLATQGIHPFFQEEAQLIRDARRCPIYFAGYSVSYRNDRSSVRIAEAKYKELKAYLLEIATHRSAEKLEAAFRQLPFEPYAPVRQQLFSLHRAVNHVRKRAGFEPLSASCIRTKRRIYRPFEKSAMSTQEIASTPSQSA